MMLNNLTWLVYILGFICCLQYTIFAQELPSISQSNSIPYATSKESKVAPVVRIDLKNELEETLKFAVLGTVLFPYQNHNEAQAALYYYGDKLENKGYEITPCKWYSTSGPSVFFILLHHGESVTAAIDLSTEYEFTLGGFYSVEFKFNPFCQTMANSVNLTAKTSIELKAQSNFSLSEPAMVPFLTREIRSEEEVLKTKRLGCVNNIQVYFYLTPEQLPTVNPTIKACQKNQLEVERAMEQYRRAVSGELSKEESEKLLAASKHK